MGYVGNQQTEGYSQVPAKQDLTGATGTSLTLTHAVASAEGIDLFINNVRQEPTTAYSVGADGVTVTLTGSVVATDDIYVVYNSLARQTSTHPSNQHLNALSGTFTQDLTVDTNTLYVDSTNNRVGVGTVSPSTALDVTGTVTADNIIMSNSSTPQITLTDTTNSVTGVVFADNGEMELGTTSNHAVAVRTNNTERLRIDNSGNVGIGTSSPSAKMSIYGSGISDIPLEINHAWGSSSTPLITASNGSGELMRLERTGNLAINTTSPSTSYQTTIQSNSTKGALSIKGPATNGYYAAEWDMPSGSTYGIIFKNGGSTVGSVRINASSTSYNTSSDYRLKENVTADWDATTRLKQLNPVRFNFIADPDTTVDGFLAHEVQDIVPEAISGTKDAVDDEGNPVYQGIDQSKLVPLLVKTIQELEARIAALEAN